ncbi:MAG: STAS domain-containing protein [Clostridiales bacterium]|nr:STAS domain-containing protein [Clostridiales bacterium]
MNLIKTRNGSELTISLDGRLDTTTAPELDQVLKESLDEITSLIFDLEKLVYISSAGLRSLLVSQKTMNKKGSMKIRNANPSIMEVFTVTGFSDILTIE